MYLKTWSKNQPYMASSTVFPGWLQIYAIYLLVMQSKILDDWMVLGQVGIDVCAWVERLVAVAALVEATTSRVISSRTETFLR